MDAPTAYLSTPTVRQSDTPLPADVGVVSEFPHFLQTTAVPQRHPDRLGWSMSSISHRAARTGRAALARKRPLLDDLITVLGEMYSGRRGAGGWAGAMRRSEIVALHAGDLTHRYGQWTATIGWSKTDQAGHGMLKALPVGANVLTCLPCAIVRWMHCVTAFDTGGRTGLIRLVSTAATPARHVCDRQPAWQARPDRAGVPSDGAPEMVGAVPCQRLWCARVFSL